MVEWASYHFKGLVFDGPLVAYADDSGVPAVVEVPNVKWSPDCETH